VPLITAWPENAGMSDVSVTIVVTSYNYAAYLEDCLQSAVRQSYPCRVVVVDDGSSDGSRDILARWAERVHVILQPNQGQRGAYTTGLSYASSDIVLFLDSDDMLDTNAVETVVAAFRDPKVVKVHYRLRLVDPKGHPLNGSIPRRLDHGSLYDGHVRRGLAYVAAPGSGNAYRRSALLKLFPLPVDPHDRHAADFFCIYGIVSLGNVVALPACHGSYRVHQMASSVETTPLLFGNSETLDTLESKLQGRAAGLADLLQRVTGERPAIVGRLVEFSEEKTIYASRVLNEAWGSGRWHVVKRNLPRLLRSLWARRFESVPIKLGLSIWSVLITVLPKRWGAPLASVVCNPAARARWRGSWLPRSITGLQ
jgi:glycosyltransferase involved in cell wall biosynthesis